MRHWTLLLLGLLVSGCSTYYEARFVPAPLEVRLDELAAPELAGRALVTVHGVRRPSEGRAAQVDVSMRLENFGTLPFRLDAGSLQVTTADLVTLPAGALVPEVPPEVAPGASLDVQAAFPLPAGRSYRGLDFTGLNLRFTLRQGDRTRVISGSFERLHSSYGYGYGYPYPWWGPYPVRFGTFSVGWGSRWHPYVGGFRAY